MKLKSSPSKLYSDRDIAFQKKQIVLNEDPVLIEQSTDLDMPVSNKSIATINNSRQEDAFVKKHPVQIGAHPDFREEVRAPRYRNTIQINHKRCNNS